ncbi:MAG: ArnT family glycosyltransferase [Flexilinea sp.]
MEKRRLRQKISLNPITIFFFLFSVESLISGLNLSGIPNDSKSQFLFGFSIERLIMLAVFLGLSIISIGFFFIFSNKPKLSQAVIDYCKKYILKFNQIMFGLTAVMFFLFFLPGYRFFHYEAYYQRIRPFFLLGLLAGITALLLLNIQYTKFPLKKIQYSFSIRKNQTFLVFLSLFLFVSLFVQRSGWGITAGNEAWYANAVPLESIQVGLLLFIFISLSYYQPKKLVHLFSNRIVNFFLIWGLSAFIWSQVPLERHFFAPGPYLPNNEFYPYSDATLNDVAAQAAINGLGFNFHQIVLKPVVTFVSFLCHLITGNQMNVSLMVQSALYAILPSILYLFASDLAGNACGFLAAAFMILHEWNALNTTHILTIHSRLEMGEFPAEVILAGLSLFVFRWLKKGKGQYRYAAAAGGMTALGIYTRYNLFGLIPPVILLAFLIYRKSLRHFFGTTAVFILAIILSASPWLFRSYQLTGRILPEITGAFSAVVVDQRLKPILEESANTETVVLNETKNDKPDAPAENMEKEPAPVPPESPEIIEAAEKLLNLQIHPLLDTLGNHFFHNLTAMAYILPVQIRFDDLEHLYTAKDSVWADDWNGSLSSRQKFFMLINFCLLSAGLAYLWKKFGLAGISFLILVGFYAASLGLARTSGGRYLVPMNWGIILVYAVSLDVVIRRFFSVPENNCQSKFESDLSVQDPGQINFFKEIRFSLYVIFCFFFLFFSMFLAEKSIPNRITTYSNEEIVKFFRDNLETEPDWENVNKQISAGQMIVLQGKALYPRFYYF